MKKKNNLIGRVVATEKNPTTMDNFTFWTNNDLNLHAFDVVKVQHINNSFSYGVIENIFHITDSSSYLTDYISNDFGELDIEAPTQRIGMNYVQASISFNDKNIYVPVLNNSPVFLATAEEITQALGLNKIQNPLICGSLKMYEDSEDEVCLPVCLNSDFLIGPEGAHLNISGISGLAAKTSYSMFLLKSIQDSFSNKISNEFEDEKNQSIAFIIFNVKGKDLMAIDQPNQEIDEIKEDYKELGLSPTPFRNVTYFIPKTSENTNNKGTYLSNNELEEYERQNKVKRFVYTYEADKENIEMLLSGIDDPNQTMEAIISKIVDDNDYDFKDITNWSNFLETINNFSQKGDSNSSKRSNEINVLSWRKFKRLINKSIKNDAMFANSFNPESEVRLEDSLKSIKNNDVFVIDLAKMTEDKQSFVFGSVLRTLYNLKLGEFPEELNPPDKIVIFIDELNKFASKDTVKNSPILKELLDITERGRSLGVILFSAEQFRSNIHQRITGNCSTHAYGRTNTIETATKDYSSLPSTYKNILSRLEQGDYLIQHPVFKSLLKIRFPKPIYKQFK